MNKKAFTLAEVLGVIVIIGLLAVIITPLVVNRLKGNSDIVSTASDDLIFASADEYIKDNIENYPPGKNYCIKVKTLIDSGYLSEKTKDIITGNPLDNYYVSANIYGVGNVDYNLYNTEYECNKVKSLPVITFTVLNGWGGSKEVIINYPSVENEMYPEKGFEWNYKINNGSKNDVGDNTNDSKNPPKPTITFTENGTLYAEMKYGDRIISNSVKIDMIDKAAPSDIKIGSFPTQTNSDITTNCNDLNNVTITMSDVGGSKLDKYIITETSGKPDNNSNWIDIRDASNMKVSKATVKFKVDYPSTLEEKKYYVHVLDTANQYSSQSFKASIYHTLTLNYNYSGRANDNQIVKNGETFNLPSPKRDGYTFQGWYKDSKFTESSKVNTGDRVCLGNNLTLYAKWKANTYVVSFVSNISGATGSTSNVTCTYDQNCTLTKNGFSKTGYTFQGWATTASGNKVYNNSQVVKNLATSGTVKLYGKWTANTYVISFVGNISGVTGTTSNVTCTYDQNCTLTKNGFSKSNYVFEGWATTASGNKVYNNSQVVRNLAASGTVKLYAKWIEACSSVKYVDGTTCTKKCGGGTYNQLAYSTYNNQRCSDKDKTSGGASCNNQPCYKVLATGAHVCPTDSSLDGWDRDCHTDTHFNTMEISSVSITGSNLKFHIKVRANTQYNNIFRGTITGKVCLSTGSSCTYTVKNNIDMSNWYNLSGVVINSTLEYDLSDNNVSKGKYYVIFKSTGSDGGPYASFTQNPSKSGNKQIFEVLY